MMADRYPPSCNALAIIRAPEAFEVRWLLLLEISAAVGSPAAQDFRDS
jgi:hypothetical protein